MRHLMLSIFALSVLASSTAFAETKYSAAYSACTEKAQDNISLRECTDKEIIKQDARLNEAYKFALGVLLKEKEKICKMPRPFGLNSGKLIVICITR